MRRKKPRPVVMPTVPPATIALFKSFAKELDANGAHIVDACKAVGIAVSTGYRWWGSGLIAAGLGPLKLTHGRGDAIEIVRKAGAGDASEEERAEWRAKGKAAAEARSSEEGVMARADRVREQEGKIVAMSRGAVLQMSATIIELGSASRAMLEVLKSRIQTETEIARRWDQWKLAKLRGEKMAKPELPPPELGVDDSVGLLERVGRMTAKHGDSVKTTLEYERLLVGEPTAVIGLAAVPVRMSTVEARERLTYLQALLERAEASGGLEADAPGVEVPTIGEIVSDL